MTIPDRGELLYEGKGKRVYATSDETLVRVVFKDDATAFNAQKRGTIQGKGVVNAAVTERLMQVVAEAGVDTHFVARVAPDEHLVKRVDIIPVEVIVRNRASGSFAKRYGVEDGLELDPTVIEWCYKSDALGDPPMNDATAVALGFATEEQLHDLFEGAAAVNDALLPFLEARGLDLVDFKLEFGTLPDGMVVLADEISPDTCRFWDAASGERLDKDRFRLDLGNVEAGYQEVAARIALEETS